MGNPINWRLVAELGGPDECGLLAVELGLDLQCFASFGPLWDRRHIEAYYDPPVLSGGEASWRNVTGQAVRLKVFLQGEWLAKVGCAVTVHDGTFTVSWLSPGIVDFKDIYTYHCHLEEFNMLRKLDEQYREAHRWFRSWEKELEQELPPPFAP